MFASTMTPSECLVLTLRWYPVSEADIMGNLKTFNIALARQCLQYLLRHKAGMSFQKIGQFTNRHHTSVMHSCDLIDEAYGRPQEKNYKKLFEFMQKPTPVFAGSRISPWVFPGMSFGRNELKINNCGSCT